jgi:hypothetical protein
LPPPQGGKFTDIAAAAGKDGNLFLLEADNPRKEFGSYQIDKSGLFTADAILHAKDRPAMWPSDR